MALQGRRVPAHWEKLYQEASSYVTCPNQSSYQLEQLKEVSYRWGNTEGEENSEYGEEGMANSFVFMFASHMSVWKSVNHADKREYTSFE